MKQLEARRKLTALIDRIPDWLLALVGFILWLLILCAITLAATHPVQP